MNITWHNNKIKNINTRIVCVFNTLSLSVYIPNCLNGIHTAASFRAIWNRIEFIALMKICILLSMATNNCSVLPELQLLLHVHNFQ